MTVSDLRKAADLREFSCFATCVSICRTLNLTYSPLCCGFLVSDTVRSTLESILDILAPTVETFSLQQQSQLDLPISSLYSIQLPPHLVVDLESRLFTLVEAIASRIHQEMEHADLARQSVNLESVISSIENLLPFLLGWTCRLVSDSSSDAADLGRESEKGCFHSFAQASFSFSLD